MRTCVVMLGLLWGTSAIAAPPAPDPLAGLDPKAVADARELLDLTGAGKLAIQMVDQMMPQMQKMAPNVSPEFWAEFKAEATPEGFVNLVIPIYVEHFTDKDLKSLIKFYKSPAGKKFVAEQPQISQESMEAGRQWGVMLAHQVLAKMPTPGTKPIPADGL